MYQWDEKILDSKKGTSLLPEERERAQAVPLKFIVPNVDDFLKKTNFVKCFAPPPTVKMLTSQ